MSEEINIKLTGYEKVQIGLININKKMAEFSKQSASILSTTGKIKQGAAFGAAVGGLSLGQVAQNIPGTNQALGILGRTMQGAGVGGLAGPKGAAAGAVLGTAYGIAENTGLIDTISDLWDGRNDEVRFKEALNENIISSIQKMQSDIFSAVRR